MRRPLVLLVLVGSLALGSVCAPGAVARKARAPVLPPTAHPYGQSYSEWAADWWQWALSQPADTNPLTDPTGARCANEQSGRVWFLAGTSTGETVTRTCTVRTGTALLFPVVNAFACVDPGAENPGEAALRESVAYVRSATGLTAKIDGATVPNVRSYFEESSIFSGHAAGGQHLRQFSGKRPGRLVWTVRRCRLLPRRAPASTGTAHDPLHWHREHGHTAGRVHRRRHLPHHDGRGAVIR